MVPITVRDQWRSVLRIFPHIDRTIRKRLKERLNEFHEKIDPKENEQTSPPEDEFIDLRCVWAVEIYTPSHIGGLKDAFRKMGWGNQEDQVARRDPAERLKSSRHARQGGSFQHLGCIVRSKEGLFDLGNLVVGELPPSIEYANAWMHTISPSLIAIVICFVMEESESSVYDNTLREFRKTFATTTKQQIRYHDPRNQKKDSVARERRELVHAISTWFDKKLPGSFSSGLLEGDRPSCEFITLKNSQPFSVGGDDEVRAWQFKWLLGVDSPNRAWESNSMNGLKLGLFDQYGSESEYHAILSITERELMDATKDNDERKSRSAQIYTIDRDVNGIICLWSIVALLDGFSGRLGELRDSVIGNRKMRRDVSNALTELEEFVVFSSDVAAVSSELSSGSSGMFLMLQMQANFNPILKDYQPTDITLGRFLEKIILNRAKWLKASDESIRDHVTQYGTFLSARENIRLQRILSRLSYFVLAVAVISAFSVISSLEELHFWDWVRSLELLKGHSWLNWFLDAGADE